MGINQQMNVIGFATELNEFASPCDANGGEDFFHSRQHLYRDAFVPVFNCQYDMVVQAVGRMAAGV